MAIEKKVFCPLGYECESVRDGVIHQCMWYVNIKGPDPQTGEPIDRYSCSMSWLPVLMIENSGRQHSTAAAIESFRDEMVESSRKTAVLLAKQSQRLL